MVGGTIKVDASDLLKSTITGTSEYGYITIQLTQGEDKSDSVIFSDKLENITSMSFGEDFTEYTNFSYACGSGEGVNRAWATSHAPSSSSVPKGFDHCEIYVSATTNVGDETDDESEDLIESSLEALTTPTYATEAEIVVENGRYIYGTDYEVGDIVTIRYDC